jgi:3D (Asp-Asp-Asp) domain-containing protein
MRHLIFRALPILAGLLMVGCSSPRPLPKYEKPLTRAAVMNVRTTAYTHSEADHLKHGRKTALGTTLQCGPVHSAAADWSRWPAGSIFRIRETGEVFQVDDFGWALAGTNTIDLYKSSRGQMNSWGVRRVTIENLRWGDPQRSLVILRGRSRFKHTRLMADQLEKRMPEWQNTDSSSQLAATEPASAPTATISPAVEPVVATRAMPVAPPVRAATAAESVQPVHTAQTTRAGGPTATREAFLNSIR